MRVSIRPLNEKDAEISYHWRNNAEIWRYTGSAPSRTITLDDEKTWISNVLVDKKSKRFAIEADGVYVGNIYLTDIENKAAEYHIFIGNKEYMGMGIAKKASSLLIEYARDSLSLSSIHLVVRPENVRAVQLYHSLGFTTLAQDTDFIHMSLELGTASDDGK